MINRILRRLLALSTQVSLFFLFAILLGQSALWAQKIILEERGPGIIDRVVLMPDEEFSIPKAETLGRNFVRENHSLFLYRLTLACTRDDLFVSFFGRRGETYKEALETLKSHGIPKRPMAQVIGLGQAAVLRYRNSAGLKEKVLIGDRDPTLLWIEAEKFHLLHFEIVDSGGGGEQKSRYFLSLFMQVSPKMSVNTCIAMTKRIAWQSPVKNVSVNFRRDTWFLERGRFPYLYPFVTDLKIPTEIEYIFGPSLVCSSLVGKSLGCSGTNFVP